MNKLIKPMVIGGIVGGLIGYLIGEWVTSAFVKSEFDQFIEGLSPEDLEAYLTAKEAEIYGRANYEEEEEPKEEEKPKKSRSPRSNGKIIDYNSQYTIIQDKPDLDNLVPPEVVEQFIPSREEEDEEFDMPDEGPIRIISSTDYLNGDIGYDKVELTFFQEDDVLVDDESNEIITGDIEALIGPEALVAFGMLSDNQDTVHVRNDIKKADYLIARSYSAYSSPGNATNSARRRRRH